MFNSEKIEKIAIIGTGIAGLGMAACLKHFHSGVKEVIIYDPHDDVLEYNTGGALGLSGGTVVMDRIGCLEELQRYSHRIDTISFNYQDHVLFDLDTEEIKKSIPKSLLQSNDGEHLLTCTCRWSTLRKVLHEHSLRPSMQKKTGKAQSTKKESGETKELIPESENEDENSPDSDDVDISIKYSMNKRFVQLYEHPDTGKVSITFQDGTHVDGFDLVIGADGVKSTVRNFTRFGDENYLTCLPFGRWLTSSKGPQYTGMHVTQCITPLRKDVMAEPSLATESEDPNQSPSSVTRLAKHLNHHHHQQQQQPPPLHPDAPRDQPDKRVDKEKEKEEEKGQNGAQKECHAVVHERTENKTGGILKGSSGRIARARSHSISLEPTFCPSYDRIVGQFSNRFHRYLGDACDLLVLTLGEQETTHYALVTIYGHPNHRSFTSSWHHPVEKKNQIAILRERLDEAGFTKFHMDFQVFLDAAQLPGGMIFDVAVHDFLIPLRSWSSESGRVILVGDSAHAMSPFLGQGANQALQDAFCLCNLIYEHNHDGQPSPLWVSMQDDDEDTNSLSFWQAMLRYLLSWVGFLIGSMFALFGAVFSSTRTPRSVPATKMQLLAQKFERIRKFHCFLITLGARLVGMVETFRLPINLWFNPKVLIFALLGKTGLIKLLFLNPMKPVV